MTKAKEIETIEVRQILEIMRKLEQDAIKKAALLTDIRKRISCLDLKQKIHVQNRWGECKQGPPFLNGKCKK